MADPTYLPIPPPETPTSPLKPAELTAEQKELYGHILEHFSKEDYILDGQKLEEREKFWLSSECLQR
jgi:hypothetical protein